MSSKYIIPAPPATGLFLLPRPRVIELTFARLTPCSAKACRSISHWSQEPLIAALGLSWLTTALPLRAAYKFSAALSGLPLNQIVNVLMPLIVQSRLEVNVKVASD